MKAEIKSAHSATSLTLSEIQGDYFHVTVFSPEFEGKMRVWAYTDADGLAGLFETMAEQWKGWNGTLEWGSIEREFIIKSKHDGLGHVEIQICLDKDCGALEPWRVEASIVVDCGQLDKIAKDVRKFFNHEANRTS